MLPFLQTQHGGFFWHTTCVQGKVVGRMCSSYSAGHNIAFIPLEGTCAGCCLGCRAAHEGQGGLRLQPRARHHSHLRRSSRGDHRPGGQRWRGAKPQPPHSQRPTSSCGRWGTRCTKGSAGGGRARLAWRQEGIGCGRQGQGKATVPGRWEGSTRWRGGGWRGADRLDCVRRRSRAFGAGAGGGSQGGGEAKQGARDSLPLGVGLSRLHLQEPSICTGL